MKSRSIIMITTILLLLFLISSINTSVGSLGAAKMTITKRTIIETVPIYATGQIKVGDVAPPSGDEIVILSIDTLVVIYPDGTAEKIGEFRVTDLPVLHIGDVDPRYSYKEIIVVKTGATENNIVIYYWDNGWNSYTISTSTYGFITINGSAVGDVRGDSYDEIVITGLYFGFPSYKTSVLYYSLGSWVEEVVGTSLYQYNKISIDEFDPTNTNMEIIGAYPVLGAYNINVSTYSGGWTTSIVATVYKDITSNIISEDVNSSAPGNELILSVNDSILELYNEGGIYFNRTIDNNSAKIVLDKDVDPKYSKEIVAVNSSSIVEYNIVAGTWAYEIIGYADYINFADIGDFDDTISGNELYYLCPYKVFEAYWDGIMWVHKLVYESYGSFFVAGIGDFDAINGNESIVYTSNGTIYKIWESAENVYSNITLCYVAGGIRKVLVKNIYENTSQYELIVANGSEDTTIYDIYGIPLRLLENFSACDWGDVDPDLPGNELVGFNGTHIALMHFDGADWTLEPVYEYNLSVVDVMVGNFDFHTGQEIVSVYLNTTSWETLVYEYYKDAGVWVSNKIATLNGLGFAVLKGNINGTLDSPTDDIVVSTIDIEYSGTSLVITYYVYLISMDVFGSLYISSISSSDEIVGILAGDFNPEEPGEELLISNIVQKTLINATVRQNVLKESEFYSLGEKVLSACYGDFLGSTNGTDILLGGEGLWVLNLYVQPQQGGEEEEQPGGGEEEEQPGGGGEEGKEGGVLGLAIKIAVILGIILSILSVIAVIRKKREKKIPPPPPPVTPSEESKPE